MQVLRETLAHLRAGRWNEAHHLVQSDTSPLSPWLHGIVHLQEGDLEDAEYWYTQANRPFRSRGSLAQELDRFEAALLAEQTASAAHAVHLPQGADTPDQRGAAGLGHTLR